MKRKANLGVSLKERLFSSPGLSLIFLVESRKPSELTRITCSFLGESFKLSGLWPLNSPSTETRALVGVEFTTTTPGPFLSLTVLSVFFFPAVTLTSSLFSL